MCSRSLTNAGSQKIASQIIFAHFASFLFSVPCAAQSISKHCPTEPAEKRELYSWHAHDTHTIEAFFDLFMSSPVSQGVDEGCVGSRKSAFSSLSSPLASAGVSQHTNTLTRILEQTSLAAHRKIFLSRSRCVFLFLLSGYFSLLLKFSLEIAFNMADEDSTFYTELLVIFREYWAEESVNLCWRLIWVNREPVGVLCKAPQWKLPANYANVYTYKEKIVHTITLSTYNIGYLCDWLRNVKTRLHAVTFGLETSCSAAISVW